MARALLIVALLLGLGGCSVFPATLPDESDGGKSRVFAPPSGKDAGHPTDGAATGDDSTDPVSPSSGECGSNTTKKSCVDCCNANHMPGGSLYLQAFGDCACGTTDAGPCATECSTDFCAGKGAAPGSACATCLDTAFKGTCGTTADTPCTANADCAAWNTCATSSKCDVKP